jgi:Asp-tRNA(Asn)/Glu-tRNA(Gln) amidotransferase C subunit
MGDIVDILDKQNDRFQKENEVLAPLLKEIDLIMDQGIMSFVRKALYMAPSHFWTVPSYSDNPPDEHEEQGNILHTKRVVRIAKYMADAQERPETERDIIIAAALLHDITKYIAVLDDKPVYDVMYPYTVDNFVSWLREDEEQSSSESGSSVFLIDKEHLLQILRLIRCHRGVWSPIPETIPATTAELTLHLADLLANNLANILDGDDIQEWRWTKQGDDK